MNWRDLLYFSKGERRALTLLLCLISMAGMLLIINDSVKQKESIAETHYIVSPENAPSSIVQIDTTKSVLIEPERRNSQYSYSKKKSGYERKSYPTTSKYPVGTVIELNTADTTTLKKVPGIGSAFANRIVKYRSILGGFYSVDQLREVYGIDDERYHLLKGWFYTDTLFVSKLPVNYLAADSLAKHPYINYKQAKAIYQLRKQKGRLSGWENLRLFDEFTDFDRKRLHNYLSF